MKKFAIIKNNRVENIILAPDNFILENAVDISNTEISIGDDFINGVIYKQAVTEQSIEQTLLKNRKLKREFGISMIDKIAVMNDTKGLSHEAVDNFMNNSVIKNLKSHLEAGNIATFIYKLTDADTSLLFSNIEKDAVILNCQNFLTSIKE